jgi:hypothetical protein
LTVLFQILFTWSHIWLFCLVNSSYGHCQTNHCNRAQTDLEPGHYLWMWCLRMMR